MTHTHQGLPLPHSVTQRMRIGLLGGSFNPAHDGHRHISFVALKRLNVDEVWWVVSPQNPLKKNDDTADYATRLTHAEHIAQHPRIRITDLEHRFGTRYTIDTIRRLKAISPTTSFTWIMGADNFIQMPLWKEWTSIMESVPVAIIARPGEHIRAGLCQAAIRYASHRLDSRDAARLPHTEPPAWCYIPDRLHPLSSTQIRAKTR